MRYEPHVALVDLFVGEESGAEIAERLTQLTLAPRILLISGAGRISRARGARGGRVRLHPQGPARARGGGGGARGRRRGAGLPGAAGGDRRAC